MERPSFVTHGVLRLPPGFRFHPTDQELVLQYLRRKAFSCPLPASIIPELDLARYSPWDLPPCGSNQEERYFFNLRETKYPGGNQSSRATESGYWKATGKERAVRCSSSSSSSNNQQQVVVGMKKVLVFYQGKPHNGRRTDWMMHEYRLAGTVAPTRNWVLCRIFSKNRGGVESQELMDDNLRPAGPSSSSSSDSSCITEMISEEEDTSSSSS